jgi:hypothetical protein
MNTYYGELGGGFYSYSQMQSYSQNIWDEGSQWQLMAENVFDNMQRLKEKQIGYTKMPENVEKQYDLLAWYYREITYPSMDIYQDYLLYKEDEKLAERNVEWKELLQYAMNERNNNGPIVQKYSVIPEDINEQIYMVNAWYRLLGKPPVTKTEVSRQGKEIWQQTVNSAFEMSNGKIGIERIEIPNLGAQYYYFVEAKSFEYYWNEYATSGN